MADEHTTLVRKAFEDAERGRTPNSTASWCMGAGSRVLGARGPAGLMQQIGALPAPEQAG